MDAVEDNERDDVEVGLLELREKLGQFVDLVFHRDKVVRVHRGRRPMAVLVSEERYERMRAAAAHSASPDRVAG